DYVSCGYISEVCLIGSVGILCTFLFRAIYFERYYGLISGVSDACCVSGILLFPDSSFSVVTGYF
ncbi:MAG: hypothetical protein V8S95_11810, partial [Odoribacter sp.]